MSGVSRSSARKGASKELKERRALRHEAQAERQAANRKAGGPTPWAIRKAARRKARINVPLKPRTPSGMIVNPDGTLRFDTVQARNDAMVGARQREEEKAAIDLEKRNAKAKAKQARANKPKVAPVTVRKTK